LDFTCTDTEAPIHLRWEPFYYGQEQQPIFGIVTFFCNENKKIIFFPNFRLPDLVGNAYGTRKQTKKTEQKGTDDEIAVTDEESRPFTVIGYFVVCPFLAVLCEYTFKKCQSGFRNHIKKNLSGSGNLNFVYRAHCMPEKHQE